MEYLYLILTIFTISIQSITRKSYNIKTPGGGVFIFSAVSIFSAMIFFICSATHPLNFSVAMIPYSLGFGISYGLTVIFSFLSIKEGPLSLTSLITSFSLIIPTVAGIVLFEEKAGIMLYIGLGLLLASLALINLKNEDCKITLKWLIYVGLTFFGNGICSTVQNTYVRLGVGNKNEFMIIALAIACAMLIVLTLATERKKIALSLRRGVITMTVTGVANGVSNLFVILLSTMMSASLLFPLISAGGIVLTSLIAIFYYKEKLSVTQYVGMLLGIASIVFMNLN